MPWVRNRTAAGKPAFPWVSSTSSKAGVSGSERRTQRPTATTTMLSRNGIRQPQERRSSSGSAPMGMNTSVDRIRPIWVPLRVKLVKKPRRLAGACSKDMELAPACSPAAESPCRKRRMTSRIGASTPTWA